MTAVLLIEDDQRIRESLANRLAEMRYSVETTATAMDGVERAVSRDFDVVVLDLGLPDVDGAEALQMIRAVSEVPIVVATARDDEAEIVRIFDAGADDYLVKPFSAEHLAARLRAVLRRASPDPASSVLCVADLCVDLDSHEARLGDRTLDLTGKEFDLLAYLIENAGRMISKRELLAEVWRQPYAGADKTVDVHLSWLRKKLDETAADARYIHTKRGVGVRLVDPSA
jgi:DNA-binding response OmpR family regulator